MPRGCDHAIRVTISVPYGRVVRDDAGTSVFKQRNEERTFIVEYDADGEVLRIKEIRELAKPQVGIAHVSWWKAGTHPLGSGNTLPKRVLAAAMAKKWNADKATDATP